MVVISFLLFSGILFSPSPVSAQAHPGYEKFKLSEKDEAQILFARERYKESIEKFKGVLKSEEDASTAFRMMLKAWKAIDGLSDAEQFLQNYQASNEDSTHIWESQIGLQMNIKICSNRILINGGMEKLWYALSDKGHLVPTQRVIWIMRFLDLKTC